MSKSEITRARKLTGCGWNDRVRLDVDTTGRVIAGKLEVADRDTGQSVESLQGDRLGENNVVEDRAQSSHSELSRGDGPVEARVMQNVRGELGESNMRAIRTNPNEAREHLTRQGW